MHVSVGVRMATRIRGIERKALLLGLVRSRPPPLTPSSLLAALVDAATAYQWTITALILVAFL